MTSILWFRQDLRLTDNPALTQAAMQGEIYPVYILDDDNAGAHKMGGASRYWLHESLQLLNDQLDGRLNFYYGKADDILPALTDRLGAKAVYWNRCYEPWRIKRDIKIKNSLTEQGIFVESFNGSLLWEPWEVVKKDGTPYKVFSPYFRKGCLNAAPPRLPTGRPENLSPLRDQKALSLDQLDLLSGFPWFEKIKGVWPIGEKAATERLSDFLKGGIQGYRTLRDFPALDHTSALSPNLHFGEVSPHQIWQKTNDLLTDPTVQWSTKEKDILHFQSELGWREFSHSLNYHFADMQQDCFNPTYSDFPWASDEDDQLFTAWCKGQTGIPIVDAGMRQLWQTGIMHNRVRMIVASFLVKNLLIDWRKGERWFWDCLLDADSANNGASWQWVAGCGADAAPYFRIFNPVLQSEKFDPKGDYICTYVPELKKLKGSKALYAPWQATPALLKAAGVTLGQTYPEPIIDLKSSRDRALMAYKVMKGDMP